MTFTYKVSRPRWQNGKETVWDDEEFEWEAEEKDLEDALLQILYKNYLDGIAVNNNDYQRVLKGIREIIDSFGLWDEAELEFADELKEWFYAKAMGDFFDRIIE